MRVLYIMKINKYFNHMYQERPYKLYKILQDVYNTLEYNNKLGDEYLNQIVNKFDKDKINRHLYNSLFKYINYYKETNIHIICDNYECTKLVVEDSFIKIKTNQKYPYILKYLTDLNENIFICDFFNKEYFCLSKGN